MDEFRRDAVRLALTSGLFEELGALDQVEELAAAWFQGALAATRTLQPR